MSYVREKNDVRAEQDDLVINTIVSNKINSSSSHAHFKLGEVLYRVRGKGYLSSKDTWEPIVNLMRIHVVDYHKRKWLNIPKNINATIDYHERNIDRTPNDIVQGRFGGRKTHDWIYCKSLQAQGELEIPHTLVWMEVLERQLGTTFDVTSQKGGSIS